MKNLLLLLTCLIFYSCAPKNELPSPMPNIVLIMADDLGYAGISCYGNTKINTPNIDALAAEGIKFTDFHSNGSVCSPTRAALMTGKYQQRVGVDAVITAKSHRDVGLSLEEVTLAEELQKHGYNTGIFGKWHLGYAKEFNPTLQGFDKFTGFVSGNVDYHAHIDQEGYLDWWKDDEIDNEAGYTTDLITDYGVNYIQAHDPRKTEKPFFLYLPHEAPHGPFQKRIDRVLRTVGQPGSLPVNKDSIPAIYKEMVEVMDEGIGKIIATLKSTGQYENTIIIFLSDNGANAYGDNGGLRGYKGSPYEGGSRVPAILNFPNQLKGGRTNSETLLTMDLLPTLLDFIDQKPSSDKLDGISFKGNLLNQTSLPERDLYFNYLNRSFIRSGDWKLVCKKVKGEEILELYNLKSDLAESEDLSTSQTDVVKALYQKLQTWQIEVRKGVKKVSG